MEPYATLRGVAPLILVRYLCLGGENESIDDTMAALGITNRNWFYRARAELHKLGLLTRDGKLILERPVPNAAAQSVAFDPTPLLPADAEVLDWTPAPSSTSPINQAAEVDRMDDSGDIRKPTSPAQARRKAQVQFLQAQYERLFEGKFLSEPRAKELLALGDESAEIVLGALEGIPQHVEYPFGYARKVLGDNKPMNRPVPADVVLPNLDREREVPFVPDPRIAAKMRKLEALGKLNPEYDDD